VKAGRGGLFGEGITVKTFSFPPQKKTGPTPGPERKGVPSNVLRGHSGEKKAQRAKSNGFSKKEAIAPVEKKVPRKTEAL